MEKDQEKMNHEKAIALMTQDIAYIKKDIIKMSDKLDATDTKLDAVLNHYIQRTEFEVKIKELDEKKLNKEEFVPVKNIGMVVITAVVLGVLALFGLK